MTYSSNVTPMLMPSTFRARLTASTGSVAARVALRVDGNAVTLKT